MDTKPNVTMDDEKMKEVTEPFYGFIVSRGETFIPNFAARRCSEDGRPLFEAFLDAFHEELTGSIF